VSHVNLTALHQELINAQASFNEAETRYRDASRDHSRARTRLCGAQKALDDAVISLKQAAPQDSLWGEARQRRSIES